MVHRDTTEYQGTVQKALPNTLFRVKLDNGKMILAHLAGKITHNIKLDYNSLVIKKIYQDQGTE